MIASVAHANANVWYGEVIIENNYYLYNNKNCNWINRINENTDILHYLYIVYSYLIEEIRKMTK